MARHIDGWLVCGHRFWKQADANRPTLGRLAAFDFLALLQWVCVSDGFRPIDSLKAAKESNAGNLIVAVRQSDGLWTLVLGLCSCEDS